MAAARYKPGVDKRWCSAKGHKWDWSHEKTERGVVYFKRRCERCNFTEHHQAATNVLGTNRAVKW